MHGKKGKKKPKTVSSVVGRKDPKTGRMAGKKTVKARGGGAATRGTNFTSFT